MDQTSKSSSSSSQRSELATSHIPENKFEVFKLLVLNSLQTYQTESDTKYFILSTRFIDEWQTFYKTPLQQRQKQNASPPQFNHDIIEKQHRNNLLLKSGLKEEEDYTIVNAKTMKFVQENCKGVVIQRKAFVEGKNKKFVDVNLFSIRYTIMGQEHVKGYLRGEFTHWPEQVVYASKKEKVKDLHRILERDQQLNNSKLWLSNISLSDLQKQIKRSCKPQQENHTLFNIAELLNNTSKSDKKLDDTLLSEEDFFILQIKENQWVLKAEVQGKCENCMLRKTLRVFCPCKNAKYCSQQCQKKDLTYHETRCSFIRTQALYDIPPLQITPSSRQGLTGLINMMNTCYFNSCLQCLSHTIPLTEYFLQQKVSQHLNADNPLGSGGHVAKHYAEFIRATWCNRETTFTPKNLKNALGKINHMFVGYGQQDSHEAFTFIIDTLNEDLNKIKKKPYITQREDNQQLSDEENFSISWQNYLRRNQSVIVDTMTGVYKSVVTCPDCKRVSTTFQTFINLTLPLSTQKCVENIEVDLFYSYKKFQTKNCKIKISLKEKTLKSLIDETLNTVQSKNIKRDEIVFYLLSDKKPIIRVTKDSSIEQILEICSQPTSGYNLFCLEYDSLELLQNIIRQFSFLGSFHNGQQIVDIGLKRPFFISKRLTDPLLTGKHIIRKLLDHFYSGLYRYRRNVPHQKYISEFMQSPQSQPIKVFIMQTSKPRQEWQQLHWTFELDPETYYEFNVHFLSKEEFDCEELRKYSNHNSVNKNTSRRNSEVIVVQNENLYDCFDGYNHPEYLEIGNQWFCANCKQHKQAEKRMSIYRAPKILVVHLNRFKQRNRWHRQKNDAHIDFPRELDLTDYVTDSTYLETKLDDFLQKKRNNNIVTTNQPLNHIQNNLNDYQRHSVKKGKDSTTFQQSSGVSGSTGNQNQQKRQENDDQNQQKRQENDDQNLNDPLGETIPQKRIRFELYAISNHYGHLNSGHYTAYVSNKGDWYQMNDSSFRPVNSNNVISKSAYMLFYRRIQ